MKNCVLDLNFLKRYHSVVLDLENCESYVLSTADILDFRCVVKPFTGDNCIASDGWIKIAERAQGTMESEMHDDKDPGKTLKERLLRWSDVCWMILLGEDDLSLSIQIPYNPLEDCLHGTEIEYSNCPSFEVDGDGSMLLCFGESSKKPKRKDNNYSQLIKGWKQVFGAFKPSVLKGKISKISTFYPKEKALSICFTVKNKAQEGKRIALRFYRVSDFNFEFFIPKKGNCEILMSKMMNGKIYVGLSIFGMQFTCSSVEVQLD